MSSGSSVHQKIMRNKTRFNHFESFARVSPHSIRKNPRSLSNWCGELLARLWLQQSAMTSLLLWDTCKYTLNMMLVTKLGFPIVGAYLQCSPILLIFVDPHVIGYRPPLGDTYILKCALHYPWVNPPNFWVSLSFATVYRGVSTSLKITLPPHLIEQPNPLGNENFLTTS